MSLDFCLVLLGKIQEYGPLKYDAVKAEFSRNNSKSFLEKELTTILLEKIEYHDFIRGQAAAFENLKAELKKEKDPIALLEKEYMLLEKMQQRLFSKQCTYMKYLYQIRFHLKTSNLDVSFVDDLLQKCWKSNDPKNWEKGLPIVEEYCEKMKPLMKNLSLEENEQRMKIENVPKMLKMML